ncbi:hypothetical protein HanRHA438_Chr11g0502221 [Helianthus annuus]|nr:hypothetical protein HanRHA438_Chr11g0502221 [Helianthus annuus]
MVPSSTPAPPRCHRPSTLPPPPSRPLRPFFAVCDGANRCPPPPPPRSSSRHPLHPVTIPSSLSISSMC